MRGTRVRTGTARPEHLYLQLGGAPSPSDPPIGTMFTPELGELAASALAAAHPDGLVLSELLPGEGG